MSVHEANVLNSTDADYPAGLRERLGEHAPKTLTALGAVASLSQPKSTTVLLPSVAPVKLSFEPMILPKNCATMV